MTVMTPAEYVSEIVLPTVREFRNERRSRRRAYLACIVTFHVKDHLIETGEAKAEDVMRAVEPAFAIIRDVCNGTKHVEAKFRPTIPFRVGADRDRPPAIWDEMEWDVSHWDDLVGGRDVMADADWLDLYESVRVGIRGHVPRRRLQP